VDGKRARHNMIRAVKTETGRHQKASPVGVRTHLKTEKRRKKRVTNVLGKRNILIDTGSTFNVSQLPKNLPGVVHEAKGDDYHLLTAWNERLEVTH
jgi:anaerobic ribonucleoside-triphosphate reductase